MIIILQYVLQKDFSLKLNSFFPAFDELSKSSVSKQHSIKLGRGLGQVCF